MAIISILTHNENRRSSWQPLERRWRGKLHAGW